MARTGAREPRAYRRTLEGADFALLCCTWLKSSRLNAGSSILPYIHPLGHPHPRSHSQLQRLRRQCRPLSPSQLPIRRWTLNTSFVQSPSLCRSLCTSTNKRCPFCHHLSPAPHCLKTRILLVRPASHFWRSKDCRGPTFWTANILR